jgi:dTMP kinase
VVCVFPFVSHVWQLVLLSLVLEAFTLLWIPAKEALVPNLLPAKHLPTANTLSVLATYGTFPLAIFLMWVFETQSNDGTVAGFFFDSGTFVVSAILIWSIVVPKRTLPEIERTPIDANKFELRSIFSEMRLGWQLIFGDPTLRAVNIGLTTGMVGGAMLATLGRVYLDEVLLEVNSSFALLWGFGAGVVIGVLTLLVVSQRIDRPWVFGRALLLAGLALLLATSIDVTGIVVVLLGLTGAAVGVVYILGFTIIQETTDDETRGRVFAAFYSLARVGLLLIVVVAPALTALFDRITELTTDGTVNVFAHRLLIPGVRITFWLAALIIVGAGTFAIRTLRGVTTGDSDPGLRAID